MPFTEICIYQVKPQKTEEFEALMLEAKSLLEKQEGLRLLRLVKRGYRIDMEQIREGFPLWRSNGSLKASSTCFTGNLTQRKATARRRKIFTTATGNQSKNV